MKKILMLAAAALGLATQVNAASLYTYTFGFDNGGTDFSTFGFTVDTNTLIKPTDVQNPFPTFTAFSVTDGTNTWTFTKGLLATGGSNQCYEFGTANADLQSCGDNLDTSGSALSGVITFEFITANSAAALLPLPVGNYTSFATVFDLWDGSNQNQTQEFSISTLQVTGGAPEPSTIAMMLGGLGLLVVNRRRLL